MKYKKKKTTKKLIITIMGHVNHGKTTLIKCIIKKKYHYKEPGNITQKINTYFTKTKYGKITILDTPGHAAFKNMRKQVINITDLIVLIIAVDDGIMPQTIEIIKYAQKTKVPIIIAINKIDKINYLENIKNIKKEISQYNLIPKEWGGKNNFLEISTKKKIGINNLIKTIFLEASNNNKKSIKDTYGVIIESTTEKQGIITTLILKKGKLKIGDLILSDYHLGKIKAIFDNNNKKINIIHTFTPVKILGFSSIPSSGKIFTVIKNQKTAKKLIKQRKNIILSKKYIKENKKDIKIKFTQHHNNKLNLIIKGETFNSSKAIIQLIKSTFKKKKYKLIKLDIGNINKTDILLANTSQAIIIAFNTKTENNNVKKYADKLKVKIYYFNIIYKLIEKIKNIISILHKRKNKHQQGKAIIKNIFKSPNNSNIIAGCLITEGQIKTTDTIKIKRNNYLIFKGKLKSIKIFKKKVNYVKKGQECGINIKNFSHFKIGDIIKTHK